MLQNSFYSELVSHVNGDITFANKKDKYKLKIRQLNPTISIDKKLRSYVYGGNDFFMWFYTGGTDQLELNLSFTRFFLKKIVYVENILEFKTLLNTFRELEHKLCDTTSLAVSCIISKFVTIYNLSDFLDAADKELYEHVIGNEQYIHEYYIQHHHIDDNTLVYFSDLLGIHFDHFTEFIDIVKPIAPKRTTVGTSTRTNKRIYYDNK